MSDTRLPLRDQALKQANDAVFALSHLMETLGQAAHPQEFGMDGCPGCKTLDELRETSDALHRACRWLEVWQPEAREALGA